MSSRDDLFGPVAVTGREGWGFGLSQTDKTGGLCPRAAHCAKPPPCLHRNRTPPMSSIRQG